MPQLIIPPQPSFTLPQLVPSELHVLGTHESIERPASETVSSTVFSASEEMMSDAPSGPSLAGAA